MKDLSLPEEPGNEATTAPQWCRVLLEIRCDKSLNICVEATSTVASESRYMFASVDFFTPTEFSDSAVAYENDNPLCAKYAVRVDLAQKRVMAT